MFRLDQRFVEECGLGSLPLDRANQFLSWFYGQLEMRVGRHLADRMTSSQLDEFDELITANDEDGALGWLQSNFPDYQTVVREELEKLKDEVTDRSADLLEAASAPSPSGLGAAPRA